MPTSFELVERQSSATLEQGEKRAVGGAVALFLPQPAAAARLASNRSLRLGADFVPTSQQRLVADIDAGIVGKTRHRRW